MRIALVSTKLGRVLRGFEAFTDSLFMVLRQYAPEIGVTLFQGGGKKSAGKVIVPSFHCNDFLKKRLGPSKATLLEMRSFGLSLYSLLRYGGYDIVHYSEQTMGSALFHLRRYFGGDFKLLYSHGTPTPPIHYHNRCDFAQMLTKKMYVEATAFGMSPERLFLLHYGIDVKKFSPDSKLYRMKVREELKIPKDACLILVVSAIERETKRIDYILKEISIVDKRVWLLVAGQRTDKTASLEEEAEKLIPGRWRFVSWPQAKMPLLYGASDIFVHGAVDETFGLAVLEAMASGLPVILHDCPVFREITEGIPAFLVDMMKPGELTRAVDNLLLSIDMDFNGRGIIARTNIVDRFSWERLLPGYLEMYKKVAKS